MAVFASVRRAADGLGDLALRQIRVHGNGAEGVAHHYRTQAVQNRYGICIHMPHPLAPSAGFL